jgi:hypothetical protein
MIFQTFLSLCIPVGTYVLYIEQRSSLVGLG